MKNLRKIKFNNSPLTMEQKKLINFFENEFDVR